MRHTLCRLGITAISVSLFQRVGEVFSSWLVRFDSLFAIMFPYFQGNSCSPYIPETTSCTLGNVVDYSINVTSAENVLAGIKFAQEANIRLIIKNTGHD